MGDSRKKLGALGEKVALAYLKERGYQIRETNYRCREGEIDIVAQQGDCLVAVEVRSKGSHVFGSPEESVTPAKKARLTAALLHYLATHPHLPPNWRVDLVAVEVGEGGKVKRIELIEDALA